MGDKLYFERAAIIGVGLIGGSLARAIKKKGLAGKVIGAGRSKENMEKALELGIIDEIATPEKSVENADIVFFCGPVLSIPKTLQKIAPRIKDGALVSDTGSTKMGIVNTGDRIAEDRFAFVGSHPIAGTEKSGAAASSDNLFEGHKCIITKTDSTPEEGIEKIKRLWEEIGMETVIMDPETHDRIMAAVSHLPHMVVYALVNVVSELEKEDDLLKFAAGGFRDFTRIASSPPEMWADIVLTNPVNVWELIGMVRDQLDQIESAIRARDQKRLKELFKNSNSFRNKLL